MERKILRWAENGNSTGHNKGGCRGILSSHPEIVDAIKTRLEFLRICKPYNSPRHNCCIYPFEIEPTIFSHIFKDRSSFCVSESFGHKFLHDILSWSPWKVTQATQKLSKYWENQHICSFFARHMSSRNKTYLFISTSTLTRLRLSTCQETKWHGQRWVLSRLRWLEIGRASCRERV